MSHDGGEVMRIPVAQKERHTARRQALRDLMQHGLRHGQRAFPHLDAQQQFALRVNRRPHPVGGTREPRNRLGFPSIPVSGRTEHGVQFVELDLIEG
jgi:hypothetical protein